MKAFRRSVVSLCVLLAPWASHSAPADPATKAEAVDQEVVVQATRANLTKLANEVMKSEFDFFEHYNRLNTRRDYAVRCYDEPHTGSRFRYKRCQPQYQVDAEAVQGREFALGLGSGMSAGSTGGRPATSGGAMASGAEPSMGGVDSAPSISGFAPVGAGLTTPAFMAIEGGRSSFKQHMIDVAKANPELIKLLQDHAALVKRYEALYYRVNGRAARTGEDSAPAHPR